VPSMSNSTAAMSTVPPDLPVAQVCFW